VAGTFSWKTPDTTLNKSGRYDVVFTPDDTVNYLPCSGQVAVTVKTVINDSETDTSNDDTSSPGADKVISDPKTSIEVDISDTVLPDDVTAISVDAEEVSESGTQSGVVNAIKELISRDDDLEKASNVAIYDLTLLDQNDAPVQIDGKLTVKIPVPDGMGSKLRVYRYDDASDKLVEVDAAVEDGYIVISTSQTGYLTIVELPEESIPETGQNADGKNLPENETAFPWIWIIFAAALICVILIGVIIVRDSRKRKI
jgi:hypothetical protein